jgi:pyridinium-3,5-biscarboxylic acid mononucleotide sulfurtransferase
MATKAKTKLNKLKDYFSDLGSAAVAFSGGVDSSVLAKAAYDSLGDKAIAVTIVSPTNDPSEIANAKRIAKEIGIKHILVKHSELANRCFRENKPNRCYYCKKEIIFVLRKAAKRYGIKNIVEGTNAEDIQGHRPGYKAVKESKAITPLAELGITKHDVRVIARLMKLSNAEKPSTACLASRIPYGTPITSKLLKKVSSAESIIRRLGIKQLRVRCFDELAVIEVVPEDFSIILENSYDIDLKMKKLGFKRVTLDLAGYSTGSMDK